MSRVPKFATYEDILDAPEHRVAEILAGACTRIRGQGPGMRVRQRL